MPSLSHAQVRALRERTREHPAEVVVEATALLETARQSGDRRALVAVLTVLASGLLWTGEHNRARETFTEALALAEGDRQSEARVLMDRVMLFVLVGESQTVESDTARLLETYDALDDPKERTATFNALAGVAFRNGEPSQAIRWLEEAKRTALNGGDHAGATLAIANAAIVHVEIGQYGEAVRALREARRLSDSPQTADFVQSQHILLYSRLGQFERALALIDQHLDVRAESLSGLSVQVFLNNRADALVNLGRPTEAIEVVERHGLHLHPGQRLAAEALDTLGRAYVQLGRVEEARRALHASLEGFTAAETPQDTVKPLLNLAELELPTDPRLSLTLSRQVLDLLGDDPPREQLARTLRLRARAHAAAGEYQLAYEVGEQQRALQDDLDRLQEQRRLEVAFAELEFERVEATARIQREALHDARQEVAEVSAQLEARVGERTRELQVANEELRSFSRSVSHYLRTPMQVIVGYAGLLDQGPAALRTRYAQAIIESTERMAEVLDGLLTYATRGGVPVVVQDVDLSRIVAQAWQDQAPGAAAVPLDVPALPLVRGDPAALRVAFGNLLHNAVKFTRDQPRPHVQVRSQREPGVVVVEVRDNGVGFDPADAERLFGTFTRLPTVTRFEGLGLGLADVWRIVIAHGGHVRAEGRPGRGASFFVTLPVADDLPGDP